MKILKQICCLLVVSLLGTYSLSAQKKPMETVKEYFKYFDMGDAKMASAKFAPAFKFTAPISPMSFDKEGWIMVSTGFKHAFPDTILITRW